MFVFVFVLSSFGENNEKSFSTFVNDGHDPSQDNCDTAGCNDKVDLIMIDNSVEDTTDYD